MKEIFRHRESARLLVDGIVVGLVAGGATVFYRYILMVLENLRGDLYAGGIPDLILLTGLALVSVFIIDGLLTWAPLSGGSGIPQIQGEVLGVFKMKATPTMVSKIIGGALAAFIGLALGREGPSIQIGGAAGKWTSQKLKRSISKEKLLVTAGAAAGLSAAFSAPLSGILFAVEEIHKNTSKTMVAVVVTASVVAQFIAGVLFQLEPVFTFNINTFMPLKYYGHIIFLSAITAGLGILFIKGIMISLRAYGKIPFPRKTVLLVVFLLTIVIGKLNPDLLGGGHHLMEYLEETPVSFYYLIFLLISRFIFTCSAYGSGVQGGIFLPILVLGGILGILYHKLATTLGFLPDLYQANLIVLAMVAILTAVVRAPILSVVLVLEMSGSVGQVLALCLASIVAYFVAEVLKEKPIYERLLARMIQSSDEIETSEVTAVFETVVPHGSKLEGMEIRKIPFTEGGLIIEVHRQGKVFVPRGLEKLQGGDQLTVVAADKDFYAMQKVLQEYGEMKE